MEQLAEQFPRSNLPSRLESCAFVIFVATGIIIPHGFKCFRCPPCLEKAEKVIQTVYRWVEASEGRYQDDSTAVTVFPRSARSFSSQNSSPPMIYYITILINVTLRSSWAAGSWEKLTKRLQRANVWWSSLLHLRSFRNIGSWCSDFHPFGTSRMK